jgi:hypothetical protein
MDAATAAWDLFNRIGPLEDNVLQAIIESPLGRPSFYLDRPGSGCLLEVIAEARGIGLWADCLLGIPAPRLLEVVADNPRGLNGCGPMAIAVDYDKRLARFGQSFIDALRAEAMSRLRVCAEASV